MKKKEKTIIHRTLFIILILMFIFINTNIVIGEAIFRISFPNGEITEIDLEKEIWGCNYHGGIWCGSLSNGDCYGKYSTSSIDLPDIPCVIEENQAIILNHSQHEFTEKDPKKIKFKSLEIRQNIVLQFYNTFYHIHPISAEARCPVGYGNVPGYPFSAPSKGGAGGAGVYKSYVSQDRWSGGGAAGAAGGILGQQGGTAVNKSGGSGQGCGNENPCGRDGKGDKGGLPGGFVSIEVEQLIVYGTLSVSGESGRDGEKGLNKCGYRNNNADGGGPGSGGGGAGIITLYFEEINMQSGQITAIGGHGGHGGAGGSGDRRGAGGGGGGGGGFGGIINLFPQSNIDLTNMQDSLKCDKGKGGEGGIEGSGRDGSPEPGEDGEDGAQGYCDPGKINEMDPTGEGTLFPFLCSDREDNDGNLQKDMNDYFCRLGKYDVYDDGSEIIYWDSSIWDLYRTYEFYNESAKNGSDLVCGDDVFQAEICDGEFNQFQYCDFAEDSDVECLQDYKCLLFPFNSGHDEDTCYYKPEESVWSSPNCCSFVFADGCASNKPYCYEEYSGYDLFCYENMTFCQDQGEECSSDYCTKKITQISCQRFMNEDDCSTYDCDWIPNEEFDLQDLGYIIPDGAYACFDNSRDWPGDENSYSSSIFFPNHNYTWRLASSFPGVIMRAHDNFYVSNLESWYYCDAQQQNRFPHFNLTEYQTLPVSELSMTPSCSETINKFTGLNIEDCQQYDEHGHSSGDCEHMHSGDEGFCPTLLNPLNDNRTFNVSKANFKTACGDCMLKGGTGEFQFLNKYLEDNPEVMQEGFCEVYWNDPSCDPNELNTDEEFLSSWFCKEYPRQCLGVAFSTQDSCKTIHEAFDYYYSGDDVKLCELETEFCYNGFLTRSKEGDEVGSCCVGRYSYCHLREELSCQEQGGQLYNEQNEMCLGEEYVVDEELCCFGRVTPNPSILLPGIVNGDSFICYAHQNKSFITECCGAEEGCINENNALSGYRDLPTQVYALTGASYHMITSFDSVSTGEQVLTKTIQSEDNTGKFSLKDNISADEYLFIFKGVTDISGFDYLEFDMMTSGKRFFEKIVLEDMAGKTWNFSLQDYLYAEDARWQRIRLNLSDTSEKDTDFNKSRFSDFIVTFNDTATLSFAIDRLFLSVDESIIHSQSYYCSGKWGKWIQNYDGETDKGFFNNEFEPTEALLVEYGPYKEACDGVMSFGWTGSACCGDDSYINEPREYWIDNAGICWNGTTVTNDKTVAYALSEKYQEQEMITKSLLVYQNKPWICKSQDVGLSVYNQEYRFNTSSSINHTFNDTLSSSDLVEPFTIKGNWMCDAEKGWLKLEDVNRLIIMAAFLLQEANNRSQDEFTIKCGYRNNTINLDEDLATYEETDLLGGFCVLRTGKNTDFIEVNNPNNVALPKGEIFIAFESNNLSVDLLSNINQVLDFPVLDQATLDCSSAPINPTNNEFFSQCEFDSTFFEGTVYYNKPLKIGMITSIEVKKLNFVQQMWNNLINFFKKLFSQTDDFDTIILENLSRFDDSRDLFISKQQNRMIVGKQELLHPRQIIRVDYYNLSTNLFSFVNILNAYYGEELLFWNANDNTQIIHLNISTTEDDWIEFEKLTSMLRLINTSSEPLDFGEQLPHS